MQEDWLNDLKSTNPQERSRAIIAMAESCDADALPVLKYIYENDKNPNVRQLAKKAGTHLWQTLNADMQDSPDIETSQMEAPTGPVQDAEKTRTPASQPNQTIPANMRKPTESAQIQLNRALTLLVKNDNPGSIKALQHALELDPQILKDPVALNLAGELTGLRPNDAIKAIQKKSSEISNEPRSAAQTAIPISRTSVYILIGAVVFIIIAIILISQFANAA